MTYVLDRTTPFLNSIFLKTSQFVSPELQTLQEVKRIRESTELVARSSNAADRSMTSDNADIAGAIRDAGGAMTSQISGDLDRLHWNMSDMGSRLSDDLRQIEGSVNQGLEQVSLNLREGFTGVVTAIAVSHQDLGARLTQGFENLALGQRNIALALDKGLQRLGRDVAREISANIDRTTRQEGALTRQAIASLGQAMVEGQRLLSGQMARQHGELMSTMQGGFSELSDVISYGFDAMVSQMAQEGMAVRQSLAALEHSLAARMDRIEQVLRRPGQPAADERYAVGMRYIQGLRLDEGRQELDLALGSFGGHYPSLLTLGWLAFLDSDLDAAEAWMEKALRHSGHGENTRNARQQQAFALLYLGRIAFTRGDFAQAIHHSQTAHDTYPDLATALVEAAVALLLQDPAHEVATGRRIKDHFAGLGGKVCHYWYGLALELSVVRPEHAIDALWCGLDADPSGQRKDAKAVIGKLRGINARRLLDLLRLAAGEAELGWLFR